MPRRPRPSIEGAIYHVYNRLARGAELFSEPEEAIEFVEILRSVRDRDGLTVYAWVLMSNHYHLAVRTGPVPLSRTMGYVQARFGQGYNRRHGSSGPRWQSRYKARMVENPFDLGRLIAYIHLNPVTAGVVDDPASHVFSGHRELLGKVGSPLSDAEGVLATYGDTVRKARRAYVTALKGAGDAEWREALPGRLPWWPYRADRAVRPGTPKAWEDELGRSTGMERRPMTTGDFVARCCALLDVTQTEFTGPGKRRKISRTRYLVAALAIERWGLAARFLAELVGRPPETVSRWASRGAMLRQESAEFGSDYERLDRALAAEGADR